jgi:hypothetical protein
MARKKRPGPSEPKKQNQAKRPQTVRAFNDMLDAQVPKGDPYWDQGGRFGVPETTPQPHAIPVAAPWRDGITEEQFEFLQSRGVQPEAIFREFFGHWKQRRKLNTTERGFWEAAVALVLARIASDSIIRRDEFKAHQQHVVKTVRSIPRPPRPELLKQSEMPEVFRGKPHLRMFRDAWGREGMVMSSFRPDGPLFPAPGAPAGPTARRSAAMLFVGETYPVVFRLVQSVFVYERSDKRQEVISAWEDQARADRCRKAFSELESRGVSATAHQVTCQILAIELEQRQGRRRLTQGAIEKLRRSYEAKRTFPGSSRRPGPRAK